jgi:membrane protease YdiL (CAAX protease family)
MNTLKRYNFNFAQRTAIMLFCILICLMIGQLITSIIAGAVNPELFNNLDQLKPEMTKEITLLKSLQFISALFTFVFPPIIIGLLFGNNIMSFLQLNRSPKILYYILTIVFIFSVLPGMNIIIMLNKAIRFPESMSAIESSLQGMEESGLRMTEIMLTGSGPLNLIVNILIMAVIPAIGEEFMFRGLIQKHLIEWTKRPHLAIIFSAVIFSAVHFQFYGFFPRVLLGMLFGYLVYYSGSLWPAIFAHFFNNLMAVLSYHFSSNTLGNTEIDSFGTTNSDIYFVFAGLVVAVFIGRYLFRKKQSQQSQ